MQPSDALDLRTDEEFQRHLDETFAEIGRLFRKWTLIQCSSMALVACVAIAIGRWA